MKIALYYPWIHLMSGVERTIIETVKNSAHEFTIFTNHFDQNKTFPEFKKLNVIELKKVPVDRNILNVLKASIIISNQKINLEGFDLLLVHSDGIADLILCKNDNIPAVCFCHTPLRPVFDEVYMNEATKNMFVAKRVVYKLFSFFYKKVDQFLWKKYKLVIFNSNETLLRAKRGGLINASMNYKILHPGIHVVKKLKTKFTNYFLCIGRITWTKNLELAISSFKLFKKMKPNSNYKLIIAGQVDNKSREYYQNLRSTKDKDIVFKQNPTDSQIRKLYQNCCTVLFTALNEDWGITALEANSYGKPTICVNSGGFKESQVNNNTGFLVNPSSDEFAINMIRLVNDNNLVSRLSKNSYNNSKKYDWNIFVAKFDKLVKKYE